LDHQRILVDIRDVLPLPRTERRMVSIDPTDPCEAQMYGGAHLAARGNEYD
jgi:hypothetical protein